MQNLYDYRRELIKGKKVVVYGTDADARQFARRLFNVGIQVQFFLNTLFDEIETAYIYQRKIIERNEIAGDDYVVVTSREKFQDVKEEMRQLAMESYLVELEIFNPILIDAQIVIYGTSMRAEHTYERLCSFLDIEAFCDSAKDKWGGRFLGKDVLAPEQIKKEKKVLIVSSFYKDIMETLRSNGIEEKNIVLDYHELIYKDSFKLYQVGERTGVLSCIYGIEQAFQAFSYDYKNYEIVLYGEKQAALQTKEQLRILGFNDISVVFREAELEDGTIYNFMYEENGGNRRYVLLDTDSNVLVEMITQMEMGVQKFQCCNNYSSFYDLSYQWEHRDLLDPTLGFATISEDSQYPGFIKYEFLEETSAAPVRIVTLGGSTTSAHCVRNRPWSYYLHKKLKELHISHAIYCGGNDSYSTSQELLRLIRDGLLLEPDIVISYSGVNNIASASIMKDYPFIHTFQNDLFSSLEKINSINPKAITGFKAEKKTNYGVKSGHSCAQHWYRQLRIMHSICVGEGIPFLSFLQPMLFDKSDCDTDEANILANYEIFIDAKTKESVAVSETGKDRLLAVKEFMQEARQISENWFYDLSNIFDNVHDVYMDYCHVYENGNQIIADHICNELLNSMSNCR